jgi:uncharacterized damage-inducible protein DinB
MTDRVDPPFLGDERAMLVSWLVYHRDTLRLKCEGLTDDQLRIRSVPPSSLSLLGLVRHCADVERGWWRRTMEEQTVAGLFYDDIHPDGEFDGVDEASVEEAFAAWEAECAHGDDVLDAHASLDDVGHRRGEEVSLRWVLVHLIEEYARHNGHADLLRERIDGATGD